jgi:hypothetical protein
MKGSTPPAREALAAINRQAEAAGADPAAVKWLLAILRKGDSATGQVEDRHPAERAVTA